MSGLWTMDLDDPGLGPATEAEAHHEWHVNAGHPFDMPGCPWDCCDPSDPVEEAARYLREDLARGFDLVAGAMVLRRIRFLGAAA